MRKTIAIVLGVSLAGVAFAARDSGGTYSRPTGNPVTTGTPITSTWANTLTADLATELTDSLSRSGKGPMLAPLKCTDGNATLPTLTFNNETNTGWYRITTNDVGLSIGGTKRWQHTVAGQTETGWLQVLGTTTLTGNVSGVGDYVFTATTTQRISKSGADLLVGTTDANPVTIFTNNVGRMSFPAAGTVSLLTNRITDVVDPVGAQDAATKAYVDAHSATSTSFVASTSSGSFTTSSATAVDVTNLSVSITTTGKPVMITLQALGDTNPCGVYVTTAGGGGGGYGWVRFVRDSTTVSSYNFGSSAVSTTVDFPGSLSYVDRPVAGTYTYKAQALVQAGTPTLGVTTCLLAAYEL
jgi:hypothetical protein